MDFWEGFLFVWEGVIALIEAVIRIVWSVVDSHGFGFAMGIASVFVAIIILGLVYYWWSER